MSVFYIDGCYEELRKQATDTNYMRACALAKRWADNGYDVRVTDDYAKLKLHVRRNKNAKL